MRQTVVLSNGQIFQVGDIVIPPTDEKPKKVSYPTGWHVLINDGQHPIFVNHDVVYNRSTLKYTNETVPTNEYDEETGIVSPGKVIVKLEDYREWVYELERTMGPRVLDLFVDKQFGFCDTDDLETNPYKDGVHLGVIDCGGNRRNMLKKIRHNNVDYAIIQTQNFYAGPNPNINYSTHPHLMEKQVDVGDLGRGIFWRTSSVGDCTWAFLSGVQVVHKHSNITEYPPLPFDAKLAGWNVHVIEYCFQGSDTYVLVDGGGLESGWYLAERMNVPPDRVEPDPGNDKDLVRIIEHPGWPVGCPPPIANWHK